MSYTLYLFTNEHLYSSYGSKDDLFDLYYLLGNHIAEETSEFALKNSGKTDFPVVFYKACILLNTLSIVLSIPLEKVPLRYGFSTLKD